MPFADKFRAMMDLPFPGDVLDGLTVESVDVGHRGVGAGQYAYAVRMVLQGPGGQQAVRRALKPFFASHPMTFSGYGNPYQLWFGSSEVESLGDRRYAVSVTGAGARVFLGDELERFLAYLQETGPLPTSPEQQARVEGYLEQYRAEIKRKVDRYRGKLRRMEKENDPRASGNSQDG